MSPQLTAMLAGFLWKPLVLALIAALLSLVLRSAPLRHALWSVVLAAMLLLPALTFLLPPLDLFAPPAQVVTAPRVFFRPSTGTTYRLPLGFPGIPLSPPTAPRWSTSNIVTGLYIAIVLVLLTRLALAYRRTRALASGADRVAIPELDSIAAKLSLPWPLPEVRESSSVSVPSVVGKASTVILLPLDWRNWPLEKLRAVLAHELAHVRRNDWAINLAAEINCCLFWFHPFAWWLPRHMAMLAEQACDELAISITGDAPTYAEVLLEVASRRHRQAAAGIAMARTSNVGRRIERILALRSFTAAPLTFRRWAAISICAVPLVVSTAALQLFAQPKAIAIPDPLMESPAPTADQVAAMERMLISNPDDQAVRLKLAVYYLLNAIPAQRVHHVFWFIEHHPESELHKHNALSLTPLNMLFNDPADYDRGRILWQRQIELHPNDPAILFNAAMFHARKDFFAVERLLSRVRQLDPTRPEPLSLLTGIYSEAIRSFFADPIAIDPRFQADPAFVKHAREFVESTSDATFPGRVGLQLTRPIMVPPGMALPSGVVEERRRISEYGAQLLRRAQALDPNNPEWRPAPLPVQAPTAATELLTIIQSTVTPEYPALARQVRIQGNVRLKAAIGPDGSPVNLTLIGGHPLLVGSAQEAARLSKHPNHAGQTIIIEVPFRLP